MRNAQWKLTSAAIDCQWINIAPINWNFWFIISNAQTQWAFCGQERNSHPRGWSVSCIQNPSCPCCMHHLMGDILLKLLNHQNSRKIRNSYVRRFLHCMHIVGLLCTFHLKNTLYVTWIYKWYRYLIIRIFIIYMYTH